MDSVVFEQAKSIISSRNGICLTEHCSSQYVKISVACDKNHQWETTSKNIKMGKWCPFCYNSRRSAMKLDAVSKLKTIKQFCLEKGGKCLSDTYGGRYLKMEFECEFGHRWTTCWASLVSGHWCRTCAMKTAAGRQEANQQPQVLPGGCPEGMCAEMRQLRI